jgi:hypothetical protein
MALGESYGFKALFYWQPTVFGKEPPTAFERKVQLGIEDLKPHCDLLCKLVQQEGPAGIRGAVFHDMSRVFSGVKQPVFIDWCHISEWGNEQVARRIASDTMKLLVDRDARAVSPAGNSYASGGL